MAFSSDSRYVASGGGPRDQIRLWDASSGELRVTLPGHDTLGVHSLGFSPNGRLLASGGAGGLVHVFDLASGDRVWTLTQGDVPRAVAFSPNGRILASTDEDHAVVLREVATRGRIRAMNGHESVVHALAFSSDGRILASGSWDTTAILWDLLLRERVSQQRWGDLGSEKLERLWGALGRTSAPEADEAIGDLSAGGNQAVDFLRAHLLPFPVEESEEVRRLIADLDNGGFDIRDRASEELARRGILVGRVLREALDKARSAEQRNRIGRLLDDLEPPLFLPSGGALRTVRSIQVLELIGTEEATALLESLAKEAPWNRVRTDAGHALSRSRPK